MSNLRRYYRALAAASAYTAASALAEPNVELRRVMIEELGIDALFTQLRGREVDSSLDAHGLPCVLMDVDVPGTLSGALRAVRVTCPSTGRVYHHLVPSSVQTARQARAALWRTHAAPVPVPGQIRHGDVLLTPIKSFDEPLPGFNPERES